MKIKMKTTMSGSPNGIKVNKYNKDESYDVNENLANVFLKMGAAEIISSEKKEKIVEKKAESSAPENKAVRDFVGGFKGKKGKI